MKIYQSRSFQFRYEKNVLFLLCGLLFLFLFVGCDLLLESNSATAPGTPNFTTPLVTESSIGVSITAPVVKGTDKTGRILTDSEIQYKVYYSSRKLNNAKDLIQIATSSSDKKQAGMITVTETSGISSGVISGLVAATKYYIVVVAVNTIPPLDSDKTVLLESPPTEIKEVSTHSTSTTSSSKTVAPDAPTIKSVVADGDSLNVTITAPANKGKVNGRDATIVDNFSYYVYVSITNPNGDAKTLVDNLDTSNLQQETLAKERTSSVTFRIWVKKEEETITISDLKDNTKFYVTTRIQLRGIKGSYTKDVFSPLSAVKEGITSTRKQ